MQSTPCPTREVLKQFSTGLGNPAQSDVLESHVNICTQCQQSLETLHDAEPIIELLRRPIVPTPELCDTAVERLIQEHRLKRQVEERTVITPVDDSAVGMKRELQASLGMIREYELIRQLGQGGMGTVYLASHTHLHKLVALKVLPPEATQDPTSLARFRREMKAAGQLDHPQIVRALDAGEHKGQHYLVMEYVDGITLSDLVAHFRRLPVKEACELIRQAALGLQHVYEHNLVHRDIKPSNLMVALSAAPRSPNGTIAQQVKVLSPEHVTRTATVKILDLGLALLSESADGEITGSGQLMGTLDFMAPEQAGDSHHVDTRADIYSLGATFYKLLTGIAPFSNPQYDTLFKKLRAIATDVPQLLTNSCPDLPTDVSAFIHKILSKNPDDRPATPYEVAEFLQPFAAGADLVWLITEASKAPNLRWKEAPTAVDQSLIPTHVLHPELRSNPKSADKPVQPRRIQSVWLILSICMCVLFVGVGLAIIVFRNSDGNFVVETDDPNFSFQVKSGNVVLRDHKTRSEYRLKAEKTGKDEYQVLVSDQEAGLEVRTQLFTIRRDQRVALKAWFEQKNPPAFPQVQEELRKPASTPPPTEVEMQAADRAAAEWVLSMDGTVELLTNQNQIVVLHSNSKEYPSIPFSLYNVSLNSKPNLKDEDLRRLKNLRRLKFLYLAGNHHLTDEGFKHLEGLDSLTYLFLLGAGITDKTWPIIGKCSQLESLSVEWCRKLEGNGIEVLSQLPNLLEVSFGCDQISDKSLKRLTVLPKLQKCVLYGNPVTEVGLQHLAKIAPDLRSLDIHGSAAESLPTFQAFRNHKLQYLNCSGNQLTPDVLVVLSELKSMKDIELSGGIPPEESDLSSLNQIQSVTWGWIDAAKLTNPEDWPKWTHTGVRKLNLYSVQVGDGIRALIKPFSHVRELNLSSIPAFTTEDANVISSLSKLRKINIGGGADVVHPHLDVIRKRRPDIQIEGVGVQTPKAI